jgi:dTDP-4-dehydrorhamnose 3,5-epimerase-like enzyme
MATPSYQTIQTPIEGVTLYLNKVVSDERGHFLDVADTDNPAIENLQHLHASVALHKGVARGEHYHYRVLEHFYTLSGTSLCILHDFGEKSPTKGTTYAFIGGNKDETVQSTLPAFPIEDGYLTQVRVPPGVYHAWWPLTAAPIVIMATGTAGYDPDDYGRVAIAEVPGALDILKQHGITP